MPDSDRFFFLVANLSLQWYLKFITPQHVAKSMVAECEASRTWPWHPLPPFSGLLFSLTTSFLHGAPEPPIPPTHVFVVPLVKRTDD